MATENIVEVIRPEIVTIEVVAVGPQGIQGPSGTTEFDTLTSFPVTGEVGILYVAKDTNKVYRWSGAEYVYITSGAVDSVAGKTGVVTLVKGDVGLSNVDNTSDASKPVSTAQQTALDLKANLASPTFTGTPTAPTATLGTNTTQLATTAFVTAAAGSGGGTSWTLTFAQTGDLVTGDMWMADVSTTPQTRALPLTPTIGDEVIIKDDLGNAHNNTITVAHNGNSIMGTVENFTITTVFASVRLKWSGTDWRIVS